ncbi:tafazzin-like isoform X1 [Dermacentor silvarum]|uniref:tafazzin-like isoform X1 n=1 Tax=Dermacentor silvarum TaxID=543639 RepID=UPI001898BB5B|nr:tafazzin-like isoform X1 [Dermacentor silvarum]
MPLEVQWPLPNLSQPSKLWQLGSSVVVPAVGLLAKLFHEPQFLKRAQNPHRPRVYRTTGWFNTVNVYNKEILIDAIENRPKDVPLITVCNHHSCLDDPFIWGMLELKHMLRQKCMRWSVAAHDICFTNELHSRFFALGKTVPVCRGEGVFQKGMDYCIELLNRGMWVHIFPEGKVNMVTQEFLRLKWGVGRLIAESKKCPIVIPFWHVGMNNVLPNKEPYVPQWGQLVTILIGNPIDFTCLRSTMKKENKSAMEQRKKFTDVIQDEFSQLKTQAETLHHLSLPSSS